ncbi:MAG: hypothetical protein ACUZ8H_01390 [Candidatus Anammoxibacter sp.]
MSEILNTGKVTHWLNFITGGEGQFQIDEPIGFDAAEFALEQEEGRIGRDVSFSGGEIDFGFPNSAGHKYGYQFKLLIDYDTLYGFESQIEYMLKDTDLNEYVVGEVDYLTKKTDQLTYFDATIIQSSKEITLKRRADIAVDLFGTTDLDDNVIPPVATTNILLEAKPVIQVSEWNALLPSFADTLAAASTMFLNPFGLVAQSGIQVTTSPVNRFVNPELFNANFYEDVFNEAWINARETLSDVTIKFENVVLTMFISTGGNFNDGWNWPDQQIRFRQYVLPVGLSSYSKADLYPHGASFPYTQNTVLPYTVTFIGNESIASFPNITGNADRYDVVFDDVTIILKEGVPRDHHLTALFQVGRNNTIYNWVSGNVTMTATSTAINSVTKGIRLVDAMRQVLTNINEDLVLTAPRFDSISTGTPWDISQGSYLNKSFSFIAQESLPSGMFIKSDGLQMWIGGGTNDTIYEYNIITAWDINTAVYANKSKDVSAQVDAPTAIHFKDDGLSMFVCDSVSDTVYQYTLTTAWDVSTATFASKTLDVSSEAIDANGMFFSDAGTECYALDSITKKVFQYTLATAWDLNTGSYSGKSFFVGNQDELPTGIFFGDSGAEMYMVGNFTDFVYQYTLSTPFDVTTAIYTGINFSVHSEDGDPQDVFFRSNGLEIYMLGQFTDKVYQYGLAQEVGEWYDNFIFDGNMIRGRTTKYPLKWDDIANFCQEFHADYESMGDGVFYGKYDDYYVDTEVAAFLQIPDETFNVTYNELYAINQFNIRFKRFDQDKDDDNTIDGVHTMVQMAIINKRAENNKDLEFDHIRDPFMLETTRGKAVKSNTSGTSSLSQDNKTFMMDVVVIEEETGGFSAALNHIVTGDDTGHLLLTNDGSFNWTLLGFSIGDTFTLINTDNAGAFIVITIEQNTVTLNPVSITAQNLGVNVTEVEYPYSSVDFKIRTDEGFTSITGIQGTDSFANLLYTPKRIMLNNWASYLKTAVAYNEKDVKMQSFVNEPSLVTQFGGVDPVITENSNITQAELGTALLSPRLIECKVIVDFSNYQTFRTAVRTTRGFVRIYDNQKRVLKGYPKSSNYDWKNNILDLTLEQKFSSEITNIAFDATAQVYLIDETGYDQEMIPEIIYETEGDNIRILDALMRPITNLLHLTRVSVSGIFYDTMVLLTEAIDNLV